MTTEITQRELRNESGAIMRRLDAGERFIVTRNGVPVGNLTPIGRKTFVSRDVVKRAFRGVQPISYAELRADLDAVADQSAEPRV